MIYETYFVSFVFYSFLHFLRCVSGGGGVTNQFDIICDKLHATAIYAHHHSKGAKGQLSAQDRSSGSGVFARDPDGIIDFSELEMDDKYREEHPDLEYTDTGWYT